MFDQAIYSYLIESPMNRSPIHAAALAAIDALEALRRVDLRAAGADLVEVVRGGRELAFDLVECLDRALTRLAAAQASSREIHRDDESPAPVASTRREAAEAMWGVIQPHFEQLLRERGTSMAEWRVTREIPDAES